jgi:DNA-binding transcriptional MerR regulator
VTPSVRYAVGDLARLAGVSRRTVRYYVQEGLIPAPFGVGRGDHYGPEHLERILRVKAMQEAGKSLHEILRSESSGRSRANSNLTPPPSLERSIWRRITLAPGVELHIGDGVTLPSPRRLHELAAWCHLHISTPSDNEADDDR